MKRSGSATRSGIDRDAVRVRRNGANADGKKPRSAFVQAAFRDSEARGSPGNTARVGAVEPSSRTSSRRCAADDRPGSFRPRTARRRAARVRRALETARARARDRISPPRKGGAAEGKTARLGSGDGASRSPAFANARSRDDDRSKFGRSRRSGRRGAPNRRSAAPRSRRATRREPRSWKKP